MTDSNELRANPRGSTPVPDPTVLTTQQLDREIASLREAIGQGRLSDAELTRQSERLAEQVGEERVGQFDALGQLLNEKIARAAERVSHLREVTDIRFQAAERLAARESELNALALAAAFAAQKEASAKEAEYTKIASTKSESSVAQAIDKLGELFNTQTRALGDKVDDLKDRVGRIESGREGSREGVGDVRSIVTLLLTIGLVGVAIYAAVKP